MELTIWLMNTDAPGKAIDFGEAEFAMNSSEQSNGNMDQIAG